MLIMCLQVQRFTISEDGAGCGWMLKSRPPRCLEAYLCLCVNIEIVYLSRFRVEI